MVSAVLCTVGGDLCEVGAALCSSVPAAGGAELPCYRYPQGHGSGGEVGSAIDFPFIPHAFRAAISAAFLTQHIHLN